MRNLSPPHYGGSVKMRPVARVGQAHREEAKPLKRLELFLTASLTLLNRLCENFFVDF